MAFSGIDLLGSSIDVETQFGWNRAAMHPKVIVGAWLFICPELKKLYKEVNV